MNNDSFNLRLYLKYHFGKPTRMNWSFPIFVLSILTLVFFIIRCVFKKFDDALPVTSLVGYTLFMSILITGTLILPALRLSDGIYKKVIGNFSGIGSLVLAFLSGIPMMMLKTSIHNLGAYLWLRLDLKTVFPLLFYFDHDDSIMSNLVAFSAETLIPAFGCSLFFFGLLWSRFRSKERNVGALVIGIVFMFWSMNPMMFFAYFIIGCWCAFLRTTTENIWGPFLCLISIRLMDFVFVGTLTRVDLLSIQTYSDVQPTFLYASFPALIFGLIMLIFFRSTLREFSAKHRIPEDEDTNDLEIPAFSKGLNLSLVVSLIIFAVIFILICKGVHL